MKAFKFDLESEKECMGTLSQQYDFSSITNDAVGKQLELGGFQFTTTKEAPSPGFAFPSLSTNASTPQTDNLSPSQALLAFQFGDLNLSPGKNSGVIEMDSKRKMGPPAKVDSAAIFKSNQLEFWALLTSTRYCKAAYFIVSGRNLYQYRDHVSQALQPEGIIQFYPSTTVKVNYPGETIRIVTHSRVIKLKRTNSSLGSVPEFVVHVELKQWKRALKGAVAVARAEWHNNVFAKYLVFAALDCELNTVMDIRKSLFDFVLDLEYS